MMRKQDSLPITCSQASNRVSPTDQAVDTPTFAPQPPFAVVQNVKVQDDQLPLHLPVIFLEQADGNVALHFEALHWARTSTASLSHAKINSNVRTLARFISFSNVWIPHTTIPYEFSDYAVYAFLHFRSTGTLSPDGTCVLGGLNWQPCSLAVLRNELRAITNFFRYCALTWGHVHINKYPQNADSENAFIQRMTNHSERNDRDFFSHLSAARRHWARYAPEPSLKIPSIIRTHQKARIIRRFPTSDEVWAVVNAEQNPVYRSLWLAAAFGGVRLSEQLNAWQCDVLPGCYRQEFFHESDNDETILVLRAHPSESRYTESPGSKGITRKQYLRKHYGLLPRNLLARDDPLYAGWKGTLLTGDLQTHQIFWVHSGAARLFAECAEELRRFHNLYQTSRRHPWYYVNIADPSGHHRGNPLKVKRVEAALERAYHRVGLKPHDWGRNPHGFRHYYKWVAEHELKLSPKHIQIMLGHHSINSQSQYGRDAKTVNGELGRARELRNQS